VPRDEWRRARDRDVARRAEREIATGGLRSYEALSDEVKPLDKIDVLTSHSATDEPEPHPPDPPRVEQTPRWSPAVARFKGLPFSVRFSIERGVSVLVKVDSNWRMSTVQALETALTEARTRPELAAPAKGPEGRPRNLKKRKGPRTASGPDLDEPDIGAVKSQLKDLAEAIAAKNLLSFSWRKIRFVQWSRELGEVQGLPASPGSLSNWS
jgi:hypothetical protein